MFNGPTLYKQNGGRGADGIDESKVYGLVAGAVAVSGRFALGTAYKLIQVSDAVDLGINAAYDANNGVLLYYHIVEHFRFYPETTLFIMGVAQSRTQAQMWDKANNTNSVKALFESEIVNRKLRKIGTVRNPTTGYTPVVSTGIDADVNAAILKAQELIDDYETRNVYIDAAVIEGRNFVSSAISSVPDMRTKACPNVNVVVVLNPRMVTIDAVHVNAASVGTVLGAYAERNISESIGSTVVENPYGQRRSTELHSLTDNINFLSAQLTGGVPCRTLEPAQVLALKNRGYVFADTYPDTTGVFLSGAPTCTELTDDFSFTEYNAVWNEAARIFVKRSIPKYNAKVPTITGGFIDPQYAIKWQEDINARLQKQLVNAGHCSASSVVIPLTQNIVSTSKATINVKVRPLGYNRDIEGYIGFDLTI